MQPVLGSTVTRSSGIFERQAVGLQIARGVASPARPAEPHSRATEHPSPRSAGDRCCVQRLSDSIWDGSGLPAHRGPKCHPLSASGICTSALDHIRAFPGQRIENDHRNSACSSGCRIDFAGNVVQRIGVASLGGPAHHVVILLRILIDHADARSRREIVKLIEEHLLPRFVELVAGIGCARRAMPARNISPRSASILRSRACCACDWPGW